MWTVLEVDVRADHRKLRPSRKKSIKTEPSLGSWRGVNFLYLDRIPKQSRHSCMGLHQLPSLDQLYGGSWNRT